MLHGAQGRTSTDNMARSAIVGEKSNRVEIIRDTDCEVRAQPASDWIAQDLSFIHQTQQNTLNVLHDLHAKLLGPVKPMPSCAQSNSAKDAGMLPELRISMGVLKEQQIQISTLSEIICRAI